MRDSIAFRRRFIMFSLQVLGLTLGRGVLAQGSMPDDFMLGHERPVERPATVGETFTFDGQVLEPNGMPAEGAVVVTSAGGKAVTDSNGGFQLEVQISSGVQNLQVTAVGRTGQNVVASQRVALTAPFGPIQVGSMQLSASGSCSPHWLPTFGGAPGVFNAVNALATFDDGTGSALYVGGEVQRAGGIPTSGIAKWDGSSWSTLGTGLSWLIGEPGRVYSLVTFDDGGGSALYVGGSFDLADGVAADNIAKWDGENWTPLGSGLDGYASSLTVFDDGSGPALYAAGGFLTAGGSPATRIAKWDGSNWSALGNGISGPSGGYPRVNALTVFDDGSGEALYAGGGFTMAGNVTAYSTAKWNGSNWSAQGIGLNDEVLALTVFDDGSGPALHAGGKFTSSGSHAVRGIAKWSGTSWQPLGTGLDGQYVSVATLQVFNDGSGDSLHAGGYFESAGGVPAVGLARWDGANWSGFAGDLINGTNQGRVHCMAVFDNGNGDALYVGGDFDFVAPGTAGVGNIASWDGSSWDALGTGLDRNVNALAVFDDGSGPALYAAGHFRTAGGIPMDGIGKWDGVSWATLGNASGHFNFFDNFRTLAVFDDGSGTALYAGGSFDDVAGVPADNIAKWDGVNWSALGGGAGILGGGNLWVGALAVFDDGAGDALYVGGDFETAGNVATRGIASWDGTTWRGLQGGITGGFYASVSALSVFEYGGRDALAVGGSFITAGPVQANGVAKWDGTNWAALGAGLGGVSTFAIFDDGAGAALYAGGSFSVFGESGAAAKWDGSSWQQLGAFVSSPYTSSAFVRSLTVFDSGNGSALYAGGGFASVDGTAAQYLAKWDGSNWEALGGAPLLFVNSMVAFDDGSGEALYVSASDYLGNNAESGDSYLSKWGCPGPNEVGVPYCFGDGAGTPCPCGANGSAGEGCANSGGLGGAILAANGVASIAYDSFELHVSGVPGIKPGLILQGTNQLSAGLGNPVGDGLLCTGGQTARSQIQVTSAGTTSFFDFQGAPFGASSSGLGVPTNYQFWYRDNQNTCSGAGFNFSNAWTVTWRL